MRRQWLVLIATAVIASQAALVYVAGVSQDASVGQPLLRQPAQKWDEALPSATAAWGGWCSGSARRNASS